MTSDRTTAALTSPLNTETTGYGHAQPYSRLISEADAQKR